MEIKSALRAAGAAFAIALAAPGAARERVASRCDDHPISPFSSHPWARDRRRDRHNRRSALVGVQFADSGSKMHQTSPCPILMLAP
jgi:hypothetical protein